MLDAVSGELRGPQAKAVVMLAGENQLLHARFPGDADDLAGVERDGVEDVLAFIAVAPFLAGKSIDREMGEADEFHFLPAKLTLTRHGAIRRGRRESRECSR